MPFLYLYPLFLEVLYATKHPTVLIPYKVAVLIDLHGVLLWLFLAHSNLEVTSTASTACHRESHLIPIYRVVKEVEVEFPQFSKEVRVDIIGIAILILVCLVAIPLIVGKLAEHIHPQAIGIDHTLDGRLDVLELRYVLSRHPLTIWVRELETLILAIDCIVEPLRTIRLPIYRWHQLGGGLYVLVEPLGDGCPISRSALLLESNLREFYNPITLKPSICIAYAIGKCYVAIVSIRGTYIREVEHILCRYHILSYLKRDIEVIRHIVDYRNLIRYSLAIDLENKGYGRDDDIIVVITDKIVLHLEEELRLRTLGRVYLEGIGFGHSTIVYLVVEYPFPRVSGCNLVPPSGGNRTCFLAILNGLPNLQPIGEQLIVNYPYGVALLFRGNNGTYETLWTWVRVVERDIVLRARSRSTIDNLVVGILLHHGKESIFNAILEWCIDDTLRISEVYLFAYKVVWHFIGVVTLLYCRGEHHILESDEFLLGSDTSIDNNPISAYNAITINGLQAEITK